MVMEPITQNVRKRRNTTTEMMLFSAAMRQGRSRGQKKEHRERSISLSCAPVRSVRPCVHVWVWVERERGGSLKSFRRRRFSYQFSGTATTTTTPFDLLQMLNFIRNT